MTDTFLEIKPGRRTETEGDFMTSEGVYEAILVEITDPYPFTPKTGPAAGVEGERIDWLFAITSDDEHDGHLITHRTSVATGPRSGINALLTALFGGKAPPIGTKLKKDQLLGRSAVLTLQYAGEYLNITNIGPVLSGKTKAAVIDQAVGDGTGNFTDLPF
jgi:hypothetical protein